MSRPKPSRFPAEVLQRDFAGRRNLFHSRTRRKLTCSQNDFNYEGEVGGVGETQFVSAANISERLIQPPALAISTVIFALRPSADSGQPTLWLPLVRRIREPFKDQWALPGGPLTQADSLLDAAARNLSDTTGLAPSYLEQLYAFGGLHRSPSQRVVSIVYWALLASTEAQQALESENVKWFRADGLQALAFDHNEIVDYALWRLRNKMAYGSIAYHFLGEKFTLAQVREVYEAVLNRSMDPANFRRQIKQTAHIEPTEEFLQGGKHRPPRLYRYTGDPAADQFGAEQSGGPTFSW